MLACGMKPGFADRDKLTNLLETPRASLAAFVTFWDAT